MTMDLYITLPMDISSLLTKHLTDVASSALNFKILVFLLVYI